MKFTGKAQETMEKVIAAFQTGNVAKPLANIFLQTKDLPMANWSFLNQFICLISGCMDARGYKQWQAVNRQVKKGETAGAYILVPLKKKRKREAKEEEDQFYIYGFRSMPVFDICQTDGDPVEEPDHAEFLDSLPLLEVSKAFGLQVQVFSGKTRGALGFYSPKRNMIGLGVENLSTWLHELIHCADDRLGNLTEKGQHWRSETVAELGAATLAIMIGREDAADVGGAWQYINNYANSAEIDTIKACTDVLERTCQAINLILETATAVAPVEEVA